MGEKPTGTYCIVCKCKISDFNKSDDICFDCLSDISIIKECTEAEAWVEYMLDGDR